MTIKGIARALCGAGDAAMPLPLAMVVKYLPHRDKAEGVHCVHICLCHISEVMASTCSVIEGVVADVCRQRLGYINL